VDEVLGLDESKLKFARRQLRVQRSKALPPVNKQKAAAAATGNTKAGPGSKAGAGAKKPIKVRTIPSGPIPKGNPALGEKLKDLPKDERKAAKAQDDERQARRLAKKAMKVKSNKLKGEMEKGAVKLTATKGEKSLRGKKHQPAKKSRVRSGNALAKMKGSRT
jgi:nucleolar protein 12